MNRERGFDAARGWAMLLGVVIHASVPFTTVIAYAWPVVARERHGLADWIFHVIHAFRNPLFFLVSGFLARAVTARIGRAAFLERRRERLLWPLLFCAIVIAPMSEWAAAAAREWAGTVPVNFFDLEFWTNRAAYLARQSNPATADALWPFGITWTDLIPRVLRWWKLGIFWFLWYALVLAYLGPPLLRVIATRLGDRLGAARAIVDRGARSWAAPLLPALGSLPFLMIMPGIELSTPAAVWMPFPFALLLPEINLFGFYFIYFSFGWLMQARPDWITAARLRWPSWLALGGAAFSVAMVYSNHFDAFQFDGYLRIRLVSQPFYAIGAAGFTLGLLGFFLRVHRHESPFAAFLMRASFWVYLVHIPVITLLQAWIVPQPWPWLAQLAAVIVAGGLICLASYQWLIADTWLDRFFSGHRRELRTAPKSP
jgi:hypothetical protein